MNIEKVEGSQEALQHWVTVKITGIWGRPSQDLRSLGLNGMRVSMFPQRASSKTSHLRVWWDSEVSVA
jgi:hypothetical protein